MHEIGNLFLLVFHRLGFIEILIFFGFFACFLLFFILGIAFYSKRFLSAMLFLISFLLLFSPPFAIKYLMQEKLYKIQVTYAKAAPLQYTDTFFIDMNIKNIGRKTLHRCLVHINVLEAKTGLLQRFRDFIYPQKVFSQLLTQKININETQHFLVMFDDFHYKDNPYEVQVNCFD